MQWVGKAPLIIKVVLVAAALVLWPFLLPFALLSSAVAVAQKRPGRAAAYATATWVIPVAIFAHVYRAWAIPLLIFPFAVAWLAGTRQLARVYVPCRSTAWAMLWSIPTGFILLRVWPDQPLIGVVAAILIALAILGWRLAKVVQDERMYGPDGTGPGRPAGPAPARAPGTPAGRSPRARPPRCTRAGARRALGAPGYSVPARGAALPYAEHAARDHPVGAPRPRPQITVEEAMAELDAMIGLTQVKEQVRSIHDSIEAARRRTLAGYTTDRPMRHFVFLGPPGTGKTTVARVLAKIFYAFGLLDRPEVIEAHRADLVGEYLGATAIKTNELVDSALGGVLFIDEAYSLVNEGDGQADRFGAEAVQALLKRAEDDREHLIIILAGYEKQMEGVPGLQPRPGLPVRHPAEVPELLAGRMLKLAEYALERHGEKLDPDARPVLYRRFEEVGPPPDRRRAGQRPVRPQPAGEGGPGPRRAGDAEHRRARAGRPGHDPRR